MGRLLSRLPRDQRGAAATEFAFLTVFFFMAVMSGLDFAGFYMQRGQINEAVSAAAVKSFEDRDNVSFANLTSYVRNMADEQTLGVSVSCNGTVNSCTNLNRTCACLKSDRTFVAASCGATCSGAGVTTGSTAGYYLSIEASKPYTPVLLPAGTLTGSTVSQSVTVRLQ